MGARHAAQPPERDASGLVQMSWQAVAVPGETVRASLRPRRVLGYELSPDGTRLAVTRRVGTATKVRVTAADGSQPVQVTQFTTGDIFSTDWTPDSRRLVVSAGKRSVDAVLIRTFR